MPPDMNIILGEEHAAELQKKHIVLELDSFWISGSDKPVTAFCVTEDLSIASLMKADQFKDLHQGLMRNYRKKNWSYCLDALDHLRGQWDGQLDSFYDELSQRIRNLQSQVLDDSWDGIIAKN